MISVTSGLPQQSELFTGTICGGSHYLGDPGGQHQQAGHNVPGTGRGRGDSSKAYRYSSGASIPAEISAAPPVFIKTINPKTLQESKKREVIVAINTGTITCYAADGDFRWQIRGGPKWDVEDKSLASSMLFDADAGRVTDTGTHDSVHADVLILGTNSFSLLSKDGYIHAEVELPNKPTGRPILGDFDGDGVTDVIIITKEAILGYRLVVTQSMRGMLIAVVVLSIIAAIVFFANIRAMSPEELERAVAMGTSTLSVATHGHVTRPAARSLRKKAGGGVLSIIRSTDESHID
jgi:hypothetical protein